MAIVSEDDVDDLSPKKKWTGEENDQTLGIDEISTSVGHNDLCSSENGKIECELRGGICSPCEYSAEYCKFFPF